MDLKAIATRATPGFTGAGKTDAKTAMCHLGPRLADLQEQLYAEGCTGGLRSLLLVLQGMDTAGKGGTVKHVLGLVYPMGVQYHAFKKPTAEEREHTSCGGSNGGCRRLASSASLTAPTMRTWWCSGA